MASYQPYPVFHDALGIRKPWILDGVLLNKKKKVLEVNISLDVSIVHECPLCGDLLIHDHSLNTKEWEYLNFFQFATGLTATFPTFRCVNRECAAHTSPDGILNMLFLDALIMSCPFERKYILSAFLYYARK